MGAGIGWIRPAAAELRASEAWRVRKAAEEAGIVATREWAELAACSHFLLYLDGRTWTRSDVRRYYGGTRRNLLGTTRRG